MELGCRVTRTSSSSTVLESSLPGHEAATLENLIRNEMKRQNLDRKLNWNQNFRVKIKTVSSWPGFSWDPVIN
jgi:hypothetical protein